MGTAGPAGTATAVLAATQMPPQEGTTFPAPASTVQTPQPDGGKAVTEKEQKETENQNPQNAETVELNGSAKAPNKKTPIRQTSFEERLDAFVGNLDLSEAQLFAFVTAL